MTLPLWSTPERQAHLVRLFEKHGNECLQGHPVCPDRSHYLAYDVKMEWEAVESRKACVDEYGEKTGEFVQVWGKRPYYAYVLIKQRLIDKIAELRLTRGKPRIRSAATTSGSWSSARFTTAPMAATAGRSTRWPETFTSTVARRTTW